VSAAARARALAGRFGLPAWLVIIGAVGTGIGSLLQAAAGTQNVNGAPGAWPVLLAGAAAGAAAAAMIGPGRPALARWRDVSIGIALGVVAVALLDLVELGRGIDDATVGGLVGRLGRVVAAASAIVLLVGLLARRRGGGGPSWLAGLRETPRYHVARLGGLVVIVGWAVLVAQGQGFAIRTVDAVGVVIVGVILAGLGALASDEGSDRRGRATAGVLAAIIVVIGLDTAIIVAGQLDPIVRDGPATFGGYALYLAGVVIVGVGGINATIGLRRPRRAAAAPA